MARKVKGLKKKTKLTSAKIVSRQGKPSNAANKKVSKRVSQRRAAQEAWFDMAEASKAIGTSGPGSTSHANKEIAEEPDQQQ